MPGQDCARLEAGQVPQDDRVLTRVMERQARADQGGLGRWAERLAHRPSELDGTGIEPVDLQHLTLVEGHQPAIGQESDPAQATARAR